ncbi:MAG: hypothetical protein M3132_01165 [Actinomycetia bacterium]|nr:hypothetical protein [Actinomycetes bacterium]
MNNTRIFETPWPEDLNPADVPFEGRTETVLRRHGFYDDWSLFDGLTAADVLSWWNAGLVTVEDIQRTGNDAIRDHYETVDVRHRKNADLAAVAREPAAPHIWYRDPRFAEFIPKGDSTVFDIAASGTALDRRALWRRLDALRAAVEAQAALSLLEAVSEVHRGRVRPAPSTPQCVVGYDRSERPRPDTQRRWCSTVEGVSTTGRTGGSADESAVGTGTATRWCMVAAAHGGRAEAVAGGVHREGHRGHTEHPCPLGRRQFLCAVSSRAYDRASPNARRGHHP